MLNPGMVISDRYEIVDKVGSGGMADVYKAKDQRLNRNVAIKILKPEYANDKNFVKKFRGEAQSAAGLSHPNIVNVYDVSDDDGLHYIVMELVEGITLKRFIERKGKLEIKEAVGIAIQIAQGLEAAHDNNIIHRDIKPQNIIISKEGKVKVTDFGIAKATNSNTITSNAMGSVHYLSPEQARGGYSDEKSDIYSLGVTLYEMLSGKVPFAGDNNVSVALLHIQGEATPLREFDPSIPISIDKIVQKCMQKRPERRYHSASELIFDLKKSLTNPDGDFVEIPAYVANDSPTINISDDLDKIKNGTYLNDETIGSLKSPTGRVIVDDDEDDDLDDVDSKVEKVFLIGSIITVIILAAIIIFLVVRFLIPSNGDRPPIKEDDVTPIPTISVTEAPTITTVPTYAVPNLLGYKEEDAKAKLHEKTPNPNIHITEEYSDEYEKGLVSKQYPPANTVIDEDTKVTLTISAGSEPFELPSVVNYTQLQADTKLGTDLGLKLIHDYEYNDTVEEGRVISTDPAPLSMVVKGDTVKIVISNGPKIEQVEVPNLIGISIHTAKGLLENRGLELGEVEYAPSNNYVKDQITYQSYSSGQKVEAGTKVNVIVSLGPDDVAPVDDIPSSSGETNNIYIGQVTIDINPFEHLDFSEGEVILEMEQNGWMVTIFEEYLTIEDEYPFSVTGIEGESQADGIVTMYVDGVPFVMEGSDRPKTWIAKFVALEE
ncbi:MAG: Stk1 family PASTA domain-containing Ser/Thr kinase [Clostridiales bacterium]|nr:Stk1 family PASTA domain-containing Ser/Thr kinase [Clostridiales bacterium]